MALADHVSTDGRNTGGVPCSVGQLFAKLNEDEREALDKMLYELNWTAAQVYDALVAEGYSVGFRTINRHRAGKCRCVYRGEA